MHGGFAKHTRVERKFEECSFCKCWDEVDNKMN